MSRPAKLALADGSVFTGVGFGAEGETFGEVCFNTSMTGYQEILTDPSYNGQIVTLTYPHIGNTGVNPEDVESSRIYAAALVVKDVPPLASNFRATRSLPEYLRDEGVVAIAGVDTRRLTRILREKGAQNGAIVTGRHPLEAARETALVLARSFPGRTGMDLAKVVSTAEPYEWLQADWQWD